MMKMYSLVSLGVLLLGCELPTSSIHGGPTPPPLGSARAAAETRAAALQGDEADAPEMTAPEPELAPEPEPEMLDATDDAGVPDAGPEPDAAVMEPAEPNPPAPPKPPKRPKPTAPSGDGSAHEPSVTMGSAQNAELRSLSVRLRGMDDDLRHFAQFRVVDSRGDFHIMFVIHEGLTSGDYTWQLPRALLPGESYRLDFFIDHDETTGPGFYDKPPVDHAWSIAIPAGDGDVAIDFESSSDFTDIEAMAPNVFHSTYLSSSGLSEYRGQLYDVRVIERSSGRLVGRQLREIPGDSFELTVGSTTKEGVEYQIDVAVDADGDGQYDARTDPSWRLYATGTAEGLHPTLDASSPCVDVGF